MTCLYRSCNVCGGTPCVELSGVSYAQCRTCYGKYVAVEVYEFAGWLFATYEKENGDSFRPNRWHTTAVKDVGKAGYVTIHGWATSEEASIEDCQNNIRVSKFAYGSM